LGRCHARRLRTMSMDKSSDTIKFSHLPGFVSRLTAANRGAEAREIWSHATDCKLGAPIGKYFDWTVESRLQIDVDRA
jgi:hypothetical protein